MLTKLIVPTDDTKINVEQDTQFVLDFPDLDGSVNYNVELLFTTPGVTAEIIGIFSLNKGQKLHLCTVTNHLVEHTSCLTKIKGVLLENSESNYIGKILINKSAQQTSSFLQEDILVLGNSTRNSSQPILEIEADDVKASHGATTGRLDEDLLYYLASRGLARDEGEKLIVEGFFESLLSTIHDTNVLAYLKKKLF